MYDSAMDTTHRKLTQTNLAKPDTSNFRPVHRIFVTEDESLSKTSILRDGDTCWKLCEILDMYDGFQNILVLKINDLSIASRLYHVAGNTIPVQSPNPTPGPASALIVSTSPSSNHIRFSTCLSPFSISTPP